MSVSYATIHLLPKPQGTCGLGPVWWFPLIWKWVRSGIRIKPCHYKFDLCLDFFFFLDILAASFFNFIDNKTYIIPMPVVLENQLESRNGGISCQSVHNKNTWDFQHTTRFDDHMSAGKERRGRQTKTADISAICRTDELFRCTDERWRASSSWSTKEINVQQRTGNDATVEVQSYLLRV